MFLDGNVEALHVHPTCPCETSRLERLAKPADPTIRVKRLAKRAEKPYHVMTPSNALQHKR